ncbi:uncharacterized protein BXZ73DRAFT_87964 [Epithele typhae]|uniref:uncharacterized protein n=1 Tax=Epithele typhae TaxID=378194 RepID=UPI002008C25C|nr:uncharacterized protein BXZ73DRAFT_87964 [Epithele typhae]KAH9942358.1 hypothetical protein BXZ73DRAFT_87964 [Epithele typhae]
MTGYLYELPTTGAFSFADSCVDSTATYTTHIAETTESRANLRAALKESKRADIGEKDFLKLVKVLDEYIPKLYGILSCVETAEIVLKAEPVFSWRTTLSATLFHNSPRLSLPAFSTEVIFVLLTYAFSISNLSRAVVHSLGSYETDRSTSDADRKAKDDRLTFAITLLCKAAGLYEYVGKHAVAAWEANRARLLSLGTVPCPRPPPDVSREVAIGLGKMALADAQSLAIRKLLSRAAAESALTPGPPLPRSHPAPALVAKLHLECAALYGTARSLVKTPGAARPAGKSKLRLGLGRDREKGAGAGEEAGDEVTPELRRYLADEAALHGALARKWLGVDAGENGGTPKGGVAVGFLAWAKRMIGSEREKDMRERRKARVQEELGSTNTFLVGYKRINDTVSRHPVASGACLPPVPPQSELQAMIPAGVAAVAVKAYSKPVPAFGPGSVEYARKQAEDLELLDASPDTNDVHLSSPPGSSKSYAGADAYY